MSWVAVAIGGGALLGAGASYAGSKKQSDAAKKGSDIQMQMFERLNQQQQPYIQSGYNSMGRLNTLLGLGNRPQPTRPTSGNHMYRPTPGGVQPLAQMGPQGSSLARLLAMRAMNGDTEAQRMLGGQ